MNFTVLWLSAKVVSVKFGGVASVRTAKASNPRKFFSAKSYFSPIRESFLPRKFPAIRYPTLVMVAIFTYLCQSVEMATHTSRPCQVVMADHHTLYRGQIEDKLVTNQQLRTHPPGLRFTMDTWLPDG